MKTPYVAIVDDDSSFASYLKTFLSLRGYEARCYTRGDELLADAALSSDQDADVAVGDLLDDGGNAAHFFAVAPDRAVFVVAQLLPELRQLRNEAGFLDRVLDGDVDRDFPEPLGVVRLDHVISGPKPDRLDDRRGLVASREHDDLRRWPGRLQRAQRRQAIEARHHHIQKDDVGSLCLLHGGEQFVASCVAAGFIPA